MNDRDSAVAAARRTPAWRRAAAGRSAQDGSARRDQAREKEQLESSSLRAYRDATWGLEDCRLSGMRNWRQEKSLAWPGTEC